jgi:GNAT superfamily N-acetyltransferase
MADGVERMGDNPAKTAGWQVVEADESWLPRLATEWGEKAAQHLHFEDGSTLFALDGERPVGIVSVYRRELPSPLPPAFEAYIDLLDVKLEYRRKGIARVLIARCVERAREWGVYQVRSWSSDDKLEAIPMWKALRFGMCPATTWPRGQRVQGYFVVKVLEDEE